MSWYPVLRRLFLLDIPDIVRGGLLLCGCNPIPVSGIVRVRVPGSGSRYLREFQRSDIGHIGTCKTMSSSYRLVLRAVFS